MAKFRVQYSDKGPTTTTEVCGSARSFQTHGECFKIDSSRFLPHPFRFIIHKSHYNSGYTTRAISTASINAQGITLANDASVILTGYNRYISDTECDKLKRTKLLRFPVAWCSYNFIPRLLNIAQRVSLGKKCYSGQAIAVTSTSVRVKKILDLYIRSPHSLMV
jgi:hypothetical protein